MSVYLVRELHLSPLQLVLMVTAMEASVFLFEVPTGVVADTYSRRLSLIIGFFGMGAAWIAVGLVSQPWIVILLWAVPFGGAVPNWRRRSTLGLVAFGLVMAGYLNLLRYEGTLRDEWKALRFQRLALPNGERLRDHNEDAFGRGHRTD